MKGHSAAFPSAVTPPGRLKCLSANRTGREDTVTKIAVITSGGDAPGMNAAVRAVVRTGIHHGCEVVAARRGYTGLVEDDFVPMGPRSVSNIIHRGGTIIKTSRCSAFFEPAGRARAAENMNRERVDALIVIGGDGSFQGAKALQEEHGLGVVGVPGTIDNDLYGTDDTIGFDTAVNTAAECIDKIRDTAESHNRTFIIEVMGRHAGFIALETGVATGCEEILIPETTTNIDDTCLRISEWRRKGKTSMLIIVAEGDEAGGAFEVAKRMTAQSGERFHVTILGHIQRGGDPTVRDRILASKLGAAAVDAVREGRFGVMVGQVNSQIVHTPFEDTWTKKKPVDSYLLQLAGILAQ